MSGVQDGLVFVDFSYSSGASESINVSSITRIRELSKEQCEDMGETYPAIVISVMGINKDLTIGNMTRELLKNRIQKAIDKHYDAIAEKFLLDKYK